MGLLRRVAKSSCRDDLCSRKHRGECDEEVCSIVSFREDQVRTHRVRASPGSFRWWRSLPSRTLARASTPSTRTSTTRSASRGGVVTSTICDGWPDAPAVATQARSRGHVMKNLVGRYVRETMARIRSIRGSPPSSLVAVARSQHRYGVNGWQRVTPGQRPCRRRLCHF